MGPSQLEGNLPANVMQGQECVQFMRSFANLLWRNAEVQQLVEQLEMKRFPPRVQPTACMYARSGNDIALAVETLVQLAAVPWSCQQHGLEPGQENSSGAVFVIATAKQCSRCESLCKLTLGRRSEQSDSLKNQI